jgi:hypothetical protein
MFPSHKIIVEEVLPCMVKCTLEYFILPNINVVVSVTTTIDLWINKGAFDTFTLVMNDNGNNEVIGLIGWLIRYFLNLD